MVIKRRKPRATIPIADRIAKHTVHVPIAGCTIWTGSFAPGGYGTIGIAGKMMRAHRVTWELANGPIPIGLDVCHRCDTPACVNPHHLFLGTHRENMQDMVRKGRHRHPGPTNPLAGDLCPASILTGAEVLEIRALASVGIKQVDLASKFRVNFRTISAIINRNTWRHI